MARGSLVAVSYPVDGEFAQVNTSILDGLAEVAFWTPPGRRVPGHPASGRRAHRVAPGPELPAGALRASPRLG